MAAFLKELSKFYGTGEKNNAGQTLEEFLDRYDPYKYRTPSCTADAVIFYSRQPLTKDLRGIKLLLVRRSNHPSIGYWALPGGFVDMEENLEDSAKRELLEETGIGNLPMEQIAAYGNYDRDPRTRVITTAYMALVNGQEMEVRAGDDAADAVWCDLELENITDRAQPIVGDRQKDRAQPFAEDRQKDGTRSFTGDGQKDGTWQFFGNRREEGVEITVYRLCVRNAEKHLDTCAVVEQKRRMGLIREESFTVKDCGMIAVDHAAIIVQALTILKERCGG